MRIPRFYIDEPLKNGLKVELPGAVANHCVRVLRLKLGARLTLFNGRGGEFGAHLVLVEKRRATVLLDEWREREAESPLHVEIAQCISRGERMDYTVQKVVELGASAITPIVAERTVVNLKG